MTDDVTNINREAWKLLLAYAESGLEDDFDENGDFTEEEYAAITAGAWNLLDILKRLSEST